jgi:hypothetical protein
MTFGAVALLGSLATAHPDVTDAVWNAMDVGGADTRAAFLRNAAAWPMSKPAGRQ